MVAVAGPAERALSRLLLRLVALLVTAALAVLTIGAYDQRSDEQEVLAVHAFRRDVRPIAEAVFDQVQPLVDAVAQRDDDASGGFAVYVDVARDPTTRRTLQEQRAVVEQLEVPETLRRLGVWMVFALERFEQAAALHEELPFQETGGTVRLVDAVAAATGTLDEGLIAWSAALTTLYPQDAPAVPVTGAAVRLRRPLSHPAYLLQAGRACGRADARGEGQQEEPTDAASSRRTAAREAARVRALVRGLLAVPAPPADRVRLEREVAVPLREYGQVAAELDRLAARGADPEQVSAALVVADEAGSRVALGLDAYGSRTCALLFGS